MFRGCLKVDQPLRIGSDIVVTATDIDSRGVRLVARGRVMGGANDGATFETVHEVKAGGSVNVSPHVVVTVVEVRGAVASVDVFAPAHVVVQAK